eukprot:COSAG06_NODE_30720_length_533_cov_1.546083_1_plen_96_part_01
MLRDVDRSQPTCDDDRSPPGAGSAAGGATLIMSASALLLSVASIGLVTFTALPPRLQPALSATVDTVTPAEMPAAHQHYLHIDRRLQQVEMIAKES